MFTLHSVSPGCVSFMGSSMSVPGSSLYGPWYSIWPVWLRVKIHDSPVFRAGALCFARFQISCDGGFLYEPWWIPLTIYGVNSCLLYNRVSGLELGAVPCQSWWGVPHTMVDIPYDFRPKFISALCFVPVDNGLMSFRISCDGGFLIWTMVDSSYDFGCKFMMFSPCLCNMVWRSSESFPIVVSYRIYDGYCVRLRVRIWVYPVFRVFELWFGECFDVTCLYDHWEFFLRFQVIIHIYHISYDMGVMADIPVWTHKVQ